MPGAYAVAAAYGKEEYSTSFVAEASCSEFADLSSDRAAMKEFAGAADGSVIESIDTWLSGVSTAASTKEAVRDLQVWNSPLMVVLFLLLLSTDCYIRKRQGLV